VLVQLAHGGGHWWAGEGPPPEDLRSWLRGNFDPEGADQPWMGTPVIAEPTLPLLFFELMPESSGHGAEVWRGAPDELRGGLVAIRRVLASTNRAAVELDAVRAYPTGFEFMVTLRKATVDLDDHPEWWLDSRQIDRQQAHPDRFCRLEVAFANGLRVNNAEEFSDAGADDAPPTAGIRSWGGFGHHRRWLKTYWVWPLPPPGPVTFICAWPAEGILATETSIDGVGIIEAARTAEPLWSIGTPDGPPGWNRFP
jgi:hypothetical protein